MPRDDQDKRALILVAAARLFSEHGYAATSIRDIAGAVGVSPSTPYYVIGNKQEILVALYGSIIDGFLAALDEVIAAPMPPAQKLRRYLELSMQNIETNRERMKVIANERRSLVGRALEQYLAKEHERRQALLAILEEGVRAGIWREDLVAVTSTVFWGTLSWYVNWYEPDSMGSIDGVITSLLELVTAGLSVRASDMPDAVLLAGAEARQ